MHRAGVFDESRTYRYRLSRSWDETLPALTWIMLNPSTADEWEDDPTTSRVIGFSKRWGHGSIRVVNLFALRSISPKVLRRANEPVGRGNDESIAAAAEAGGAVVAAWGNHGLLCNPSTGAARSVEVLALIQNLSVEVWCLGLTARGEPRHPLYMPGETHLRPYEDTDPPGSPWRELTRDGCARPR